MTEIRKSGDRTINVERRMPGARRVGMTQGMIRQNMSHGRTKAVVVEKKKRRIVMPGSDGAASATPAAEKGAPPPGPVKPALKAAQTATAPPGERMVRAAPGQADDAQQGVAAQQGGLTANETAARSEALKLARARDIVEQEQREREAREAAERSAREAALKAAEQAEAEKEKAQAEQRARQKQAEARYDKTEEPPDAGTASTARDAAPKMHQRGTEGESEAGSPGARAPKKARLSTARPHGRGTDDRRRTKLTIHTVGVEQEENRQRSLAALRRRREKVRRADAPVRREKVRRAVVIPEAITIQELANRMAERAVDVIKLLMKQGQMMKINDLIEADTAQLIAEEMGHTVKRIAESDVEIGLFESAGDEGEMTPRSPVVTIMGHVDHGKTSLLDAIRKSKVVEGESGGITQHIGAYQVSVDDRKITFIDTPGHAAFSKMRGRGAQVTDIVVLVVAADDGVMPQTREAIAHARAADVPIVVAINKIDAPGADAGKIRNELLRENIIVEAVGGEVVDVEISALNGQNIPRLLEMIVLQAELLELKANANRSAEGVVIEARLDRGRGPVATVLVQKGTLEVGNILVAGSHWGKVRAMLDEDSINLENAGPSRPAEVLGFQGTPIAGDLFAVVQNEARAREIVEYRQRVIRDQAAGRSASGRMSFEQMMKKRLSDGSERAEYPVIVKADVQGSVEAITNALEALGNDEVAATVTHGAVGGITESDVALAAASNAHIFGFNVRAGKQAREAAERENVSFSYYSIIYDLVDNVKAVLSGLLKPERRETIIGNAQILEIFDISRVGKVAGCRVTDGVVERGAYVRLIRDDVVIHDGNLGTLKRFKDEAREVHAGQECGMNFENYKDMRPGDIIECYRVEEHARSL